MADATVTPSGARSRGRWDSRTAEVDKSHPNAAENTAWVAKYSTEWARVGMTAESFVQRFSAPVRIRISAVSGS